MLDERRIEGRRRSQRRLKSSVFSEYKEQRTIRDRRALIRREDDRRNKRWRDFQREQERKRYEAYLRKRSKIRKENQLFSKSRTELARKKAFIEKSLKEQNYIEERRKLATDVGLKYAMDLTLPAATRLMLWQQEIAKLNSLPIRRKAKVANSGKESNTIKTSRNYGTNPENNLRS